MTESTRRALPFFLLLLAFLTPITRAQETKPAAKTDPIAAADELCRTGKLDEAARLYETLLAANPKFCHARAGLMRIRLRQNRPEDAYELGKTGLALPESTAELLAEMGDVQFRRAEMGEAEADYVRAWKTDPRELRSYLGLAQLYGAFSMRRRAYDLVKAAYEIAPNDPDVRLAWIRMLPRAERLRSIEEYLSAPHAGDEETITSLRGYAEFLKATVDKPAHACRLVNKVQKTQTPLIALMDGATHQRGYALNVKLNDRTSLLVLDTGADGITIGRKAAERAGLERISHTSIGGIGDKGSQSGFTAVAKKIQIGELEFEDCVVDVSDRRSLDVDDTGLIGADMFSSFLVDLDGPGKMIRLSPLPQRPEETQAATALTPDEDLEGQDAATQGKKGLRLPKDRYVAPEMENWTKVFRFGHYLLIQTRVNDQPGMLFVIDTGSFSTTMSTASARKVTKVSRDDFMKVKGLSGAVNDVYSAYKVKLQFSHFSQQNQDVVTFGLSNLSKDIGTEISGIIGFATLNLLEVKIDYRDGLVDFSYDPKRVLPSLR